MLSAILRATLIVGSITLLIALGVGAVRAAKNAPPGARFAASAMLLIMSIFSPIPIPPEQGIEVINKDHSKKKSEKEDGGGAPPQD